MAPGDHGNTRLLFQANLNSIELKPSANVVHFNSANAPECRLIKVYHWHGVPGVGIRLAAELNMISGAEAIALGSMPTP